MSCGGLEGGTTMVQTCLHVSGCHIVQLKEPLYWGVQLGCAWLVGRWSILGVALAFTVCQVPLCLYIRCLLSPFRWQVQTNAPWWCGDVFPLTQLRDGWKFLFFFGNVIDATFSFVTTWSLAKVLDYLGPWVASTQNVRPKDSPVLMLVLINIWIDITSYAQLFSWAYSNSNLYLLMDIKHVKMSFTPTVKHGWFYDCQWLSSVVGTVQMAASSKKSRLASQGSFP